MALDYSKGRTKTLSTIAEKQNTAQTVVNIPIEKIVENEQNAAIFDMTDIEALASEISENGFHGAIEVIRKKDGNYEIISGHRRYRAMKINGVREVPCIILDVNDDDEEKKLKLLITSNTFNREISPLSMARAIDIAEKKIFSKQKGDTRKALAEFFNKSESQIHKYKVLVRLIPELQDVLEKEIVPYTLLSDIAVRDEDKQRIFYNMVKEHTENGELTVSPSELKKEYSSLEKNENNETDKNISVPETSENVQPVLENNENTDEEELMNESEQPSHKTVFSENEQEIAEEDKNDKRNSDDKFKKFVKKNYFDINEVINQCKGIGCLENDAMKLLTKLQAELTDIYKYLQ